MKTNLSPFFFPNLFKIFQNQKNKNLGNHQNQYNPEQDKNSRVPLK
jgi:hypothetical protein